MNDATDGAIAGRQMLTGTKGKYWIDPANPLAFGRISILFAGESETKKRICVKLFRDKVESVESADGAVDFSRELGIVRILKHPSILPITDYGDSMEAHKRPFLVMPLCERGNLRSLLLARSFMPVSEAMTYLRDVASALDYAHAAGVIHGDIKPENILLDDDDRARLADFGAAKYRLIGSRRAKTSEVGPTGPFTEMYASPEQIESGTQSVRSDVYAFTMVAYELLTGAPPVSDTEPAFQRMLAKIEGRLRHPADINPALPSGVCDALMRGLSTDAKHRFRSAGEVVLAIESGFAQRATSGEPKRSGVSAQVFVVHGRNDEAKERVARLLQRVGADAVVLHEMPSAGRTVIEKIEAYADVAAAVVILTGDDVGAIASQANQLQPRARQNVIFELGYFAGKLARQRTIALYEAGVELPSDVGGIVYIALDSAGAWRLELVRELRAAGLTVSANEILG